MSTCFTAHTKSKNELAVHAGFVNAAARSSDQKHARKATKAVLRMDLGAFRKHSQPRRA